MADILQLHAVSVEQSLAFAMLTVNGRLTAVSQKRHPTLVTVMLMYYMHCLKDTLSLSIFVSPPADANDVLSETNKHEVLSEHRSRRALPLDAAVIMFFM